MIGKQDIGNLLAVFALELKRLEDFTKELYTFINPITTSDLDRHNKLANYELSNYTITLTDEEQRQKIWDIFYGEQLYCTDDYLIEQAANIGWTISIQTEVDETFGFQLGPTTANLGSEGVGNEMGDNEMGGYNEYAFIVVNVDDGPADTYEDLKNRLNKIKPAHILLEFIYPDEIRNLVTEDGSGLLTESSDTLIGE